jgi:hypothetical protein
MISKNPPKLLLMVTDKKESFEFIFFIGNNKLPLISIFDLFNSFYH